MAARRLQGHNRSVELSAQRCIRFVHAGSTDVAADLGDGPSHWLHRDNAGADWGGQWIRVIARESQIVGEPGGMEAACRGCIEDLEMCWVVGRDQRGEEDQLGV